MSSCEQMHKLVTVLFRQSFIHALVPTLFSKRPRVNHIDKSDVYKCLHTCTLRHLHVHVHVCVSVALEYSMYGK